MLISPSPDSAFGEPSPGVFPNVGALLIGAVLSSSLAGVTVYQTVAYFTQFPNDGLDPKIWVLLIWLFDFLAAVLHSAMAYIYFVKHRDDPAFIAFSIWAWGAGNIAMGLTILVVQLFFIVRIWRLRQIVYPHFRCINRIIFATFSGLAVCTQASGLTLAYMDLDCGGSELLPAHKPVYNSNVAIETTLDILMTAMLIHILHQHRNEFTQRKSPFARLVVFFLTRGCVIAAYKVILLLVPHIVGNSYIWVPLIFCLSRVYANSAIMTLNNRRHASDIDNLPGDERPSFHLALPTQSTLDDIPLDTSLHPRTDSYASEHAHAASAASASNPSGLTDARSPHAPEGARAGVDEIADAEVGCGCKRGRDGDASPRRGGGDDVA